MAALTPRLAADSAGCAGRAAGAAVCAAVPPWVCVSSQRGSCPRHAGLVPQGAAVVCPETSAVQNPRRCCCILSLHLAGPLPGDLQYFGSVRPTHHSMCHFPVCLLLSGGFQCVLSTQHLPQPCSPAASDPAWEAVDSPLTCSAASPLFRHPLGWVGTQTASCSCSGFCL